jgi:hypothetical protein
MVQVVAEVFRKEGRNMSVLEKSLRKFGKSDL